MNQSENERRVKMVDPNETPAPEMTDEEIIQQSLATENQGIPTQPQPTVPSEPQQQPNIQSEAMLNMSQQVSPNYWEITDLPSKFKLYPKGTRIMARPLKVLEVKKLSSLNEDNADFITNDILQRTVKGIALQDILIADKMCMIFWLRANTYRESGYVVKFDCPKCEKESQFHFSLDNLEIQYLSESYDPDKPITMLNGDKVQIKFLTIGDQIYLNKFKEMNSEAVQDIDEDLLQMARMIVSVNGEKKSLLNAYHYLITIDPKDFSYINTWFKKNGMGLKPWMNVECQKCGGTSPMGISFRPDFFIPEYNVE